MVKDEVRIGSKIEIWISQESRRSEKNGTEAKSYISKVFGVNDDDTIDIDIPSEKGAPLVLSRELRYTFVFIQEGEMKMAEGAIIGRVKIENFPLYRVQLMSRLEKFQRRAFYRLPVQMDVSFQIIKIYMNDSEKAESELTYDVEEDGLWYEGTINDISGGGARFVSEHPIMDMPYLYLRFKLVNSKGEEEIGVLAKLLDRQPIPRSLKCTYRCKFAFETSQTQEKIVQFIFDEQRKIRRKQQGLI